MTRHSRSTQNGSSSSRAEQALNHGAGTRGPRHASTNDSNGASHRTGPRANSNGRHDSRIHTIRDRLADVGIRPSWMADFTDRLRSALEERVLPGPVNGHSLARQESLLSWARRHLPDHFRLEPSQMHRWLSEELGAMHAERGSKLNVIGPRGAAKSTVGTLAYPLRAALEGWEPYIWIVSDTAPQACAHLDNLRAELFDNAQLAENPVYRKVLQRDASRRRHFGRGNSIHLANGVLIEAFGTGQRIRGRRHRATRPTLIICDDLQNDQHMDSALLRDHARRWFHGMLLKAGTSSTNVVNLATALHQEALAVELQRTPGWKSRVFRAITAWPANRTLWHEWEAIYADVENPRSRDEALEFYKQHRQAMDEGAEALWPAAEDLYTLMCIRVEQGATTFEREKQGSPLNPELCEWPEAYFDEHIWFDRWPEAARLRVMALDPSKGQDERRGDYSAYVMLAIDPQGTLFVEADLARRTTTTMVEDGVAWHECFRPDAFGLEINQFQELLAGEFERAFRQQGVLEARPWTMDNRVAKRVRIRRLGPYLATKRLRFKSSSPSTRQLVEQLRTFPVGDHDDGPDALEMAVRLAGELLRPAVDDGLGNQLRTA